MHTAQFQVSHSDNLPAKFAWALNPQPSQDKKIFNFMSGPGAMPKAVLQAASYEMLNW